MLRELRKHGRAGSRQISKLYPQLRISRNEDIDTRAEPNQSHSVALFYGFSKLRVRHDTPGNETCDLPDENSARAMFYSDRALLILEARFLGGSIDELALVVMQVADGAIDWIAIYVNVEDVHENRKPGSPAANECRLVNLSYHDELSVGRSDDDVRSALAGSFRIAKEVRDPERKQSDDDCEEPERPRTPRECDRKCANREKRGDADERVTFACEVQ